VAFRKPLREPGHVRHVTCHCEMIFPNQLTLWPLMAHEEEPEHQAFIEQSSRAVIVESLVFMRCHSGMCLPALWREFAEELSFKADSNYMYHYQNAVYFT
jgi:hypothetical protein